MSPVATRAAEFGGGACPTPKSTSSYTGNYTTSADANSDEGGDNWAVIATLIENYKLSGINPHTWLTDTLARLANGHPANAVGELMPWTAVA